MSKITLAVGKGFSGEIFRYEIDSEFNVGEMIKKFVNDIYHGGRDVKDFVLFNLSQGFEYKTDETFAGTGTKNGDIVLLIDLRES
ncbi:MAG: hypothetical protein RMJ81_07315 [Candidatus Kryptonium sp.]|nr:hypothetical protein [Candidatus Kryptonium sp.]MDW8109443.1 hypothetical protein [Candidatus Kryptonium sp.]